MSQFREHLRNTAAALSEAVAELDNQESLSPFAAHQATVLHMLRGEGFSWRTVGAIQARLGTNDPEYIARVLSAIGARFAKNKPNLVGLISMHGV